MTSELRHRTNARGGSQKNTEDIDEDEEVVNPQQPPTSSRRSADAAVYERFLTMKQKEFCPEDKAAIRRHLRRNARDNKSAFPLSVGARLDLLVYTLLFLILYVVAKVEYNVDLIDLAWHNLLKPNW